MFYFMEHPIKIDDLGGKKNPIFGSTPTWSVSDSYWYFCKLQPPEFYAYPPRIVGFLRVPGWNPGEGVTGETEGFPGKIGEA